MAFQLTDFQSSFNDLARQYQFNMNIVSSPILFDQKLRLLVESTSLPQKTVEVVPANYMGQKLALAGNLDYPDWSCTFRVDSNYKVYEFFRTWIDVIRNVDTNIMTKPSTYKGEIVLNQLITGPDVIAAHIKMYGVFPTTLGEIGYDTQTSNLQTFAVTFSQDYNKWTRGLEVDTIK